MAADREVIRHADYLSAHRPRTVLIHRDRSLFALPLISWIIRGRVRGRWLPPLRPRSIRTLLFRAAIKIDGQKLDLSEPKGRDEYDNPLLIRETSCAFNIQSRGLS